MVLKTVCPNMENFLLSIGLSFCISTISAPATKALSPPPVIITILVTSSLANISNNCFISSKVELFNAFRDFGLLIVTTVIPCSVCTSKFLYSVMITTPKSTHKNISSFYCLL